MTPERAIAVILPPEESQVQLENDEIKNLNFVAAKNLANSAIMNLLNDEKHSFTPIRPKKRNGKKNEYTNTWVWSRQKQDENDTIEAEAYIRMELDSNDPGTFWLVLGSDIKDTAVPEDTWKKEYSRQLWNINEIKTSEGMERLTAVIYQGMSEGDENPMTDLEDAALLLRQLRQKRQKLQK